MVATAKNTPEGKSSRLSRRVELFSSKHRSAVSNGSRLLVGIDHRSAFLRRFRDIIAEHISDLGGEANISSSELALVRAAAQLRIQLELMEQRWAEKYDGVAPNARLRDYQRTASSLRRILTSLGLRRRSKEINQDLKSYLHEREQEMDGADED